MIRCSFVGDRKFVFNMDIRKHSAVWQTLPCGNYLAHSEGGDVIISFFCEVSANFYNYNINPWRNDFLIAYIFQYDPRQGIIICEPTD
jgi:hypothetical protein